MKAPDRTSARVDLLDDLALFALVQYSCTTAAILLSKLAALVHTFPQDRLVANLRRLPVIFADDLVILGGAALLIALLGRFPWSRGKGPRFVAAAVLYLLFAGWTALTLANAGFLATVGTSLDPDLLSLAPRLGRYFVTTATKDTIWIGAAVLMICLAPLALTPLLLRAARGKGRGLWNFWVAALLSGGLMSSGQLPHNAEERTLRNMTVAHVLFSNTPLVVRDVPPPTRRQAEIVAQLEGGNRNEGAVAFSALPRKHYNVLLVVWESVGERYLRTHPLGRASTPNLERLVRKGSVRFQQAYAECPLSVESVWSFFTGRSPPAKPQIFLDPGPLPPHGPTLPEVLKAQGYGTLVLIGSYTRSWGDDRIVRLGGVDVFEDIETISNRERYKQVGWSIDGRAINDRFWTWLDHQPKQQPFFSVLWNVETHYPYRWAAMSQDDDRQSDAERYVRAIEHADRLLGEVAAGLADRGLDKETLIVIAGDHGEGLGRPPRPNQLLHGGTVFEDSVQVPLVFLNPALKEAHIVDPPVILADVYPTVLSLLGVEAPPGLDGVSLAEPLSPRSIITHGIQWWPAAIRSGSRKLILDGPRDPGVMYRIDQDPLERVDLASQEPEIAVALRSRLLFESSERARFDASMESKWRQPLIPDSMKRQTLGPGAWRRQPPPPER
ncbi:MAG: sulfatase [Vicinamibacteria bacterium]